MDKKKMKNFEENSIKKTWWWATRSWVEELLDFPLIYFLKDFKWGEKLFLNMHKFRFFIKRKPVLPMLEYLVSTRCTLNCKHCNTRMPEFTDKTHIKIATFEEFKNDLDKVLDAVDYINFFGFVGGEPTLAKDLAKMIEYTCSKKQIRQVFIATNCTILPSEELLEAMKNKKFAVQPSDYSHVKNIKNGVVVRYDEFKQLLSDNGVKYNNYQEKREAVTWFSLPAVYLDKQKDDICKCNHDNCVQICNILCDGFLIPCTMSVHIWRNLELTPEIEKEAVNVRGAKSKKELTNELIDFFARPYSAFCHYCHFENIKYDLPCGEQVEDSIETAQGSVS